MSGVSLIKLKRVDQLRFLKYSQITLKIGQNFFSKISLGSENLAFFFIANSFGFAKVTISSQSA